MYVCSLNVIILDSVINDDTVEIMNFIICMTLYAARKNEGLQQVFARTVYDVS